jgi:hypothetical protein
VSRILKASFRFGLASPGSSTWPHLLSAAVQASGYDSKLKSCFDVWILNCGFDAVIVHTRRLASGQFVSRRITDPWCGEPVSTDVI